MCRQKLQQGHKMTICPIFIEFHYGLGILKRCILSRINSWKYNRIIVFNCTDAWAPICIFLHVSGQNESVQLKPIDTLYHMGHMI